MVYKAKITISDRDLLQLLEAEDEWGKERSSLEIKDGDIIITANDIIAFKATIGGFIKLAETYEKASKLAKDGNGQRN
jgi:tRNA threonylcarbamoyladenosine modification (KEOPS) complex  Pcc1 subunit